MIKDIIMAETDRLRVESGPEHMDFYELLDHFDKFAETLSIESEKLEDEITAQWSARNQISNKPWRMIAVLTCHDFCDVARHLATWTKLKVLDWVKARHADAVAEESCSNDDADRGMIHAYEKTMKMLESL